MAESLTDHVQKVLECPVCKTVPRSPPIYQCENGHMLCSNCRIRVQTCPTCRVEMGSIRNLIAEKVLEG